MLCTACKVAEATDHFTLVKEGKLLKVSLCEVCREAFGYTKSPGTGADPGDPQAGSGCPGCGFPLAEYRATRRMGCPECYQAFAGEVAGLLPMIQRGRRHVGKRPVEAAATASADAMAGIGADDLAARLALAVEREDFEEAARLQKLLRGLPSKGG